MVSEMFKNGMRPVHPGEVLLEDFLKPLGMSANALAKAPRRECGHSHETRTLFWW
jgi:hypothetical protein